MKRITVSLPDELVDRIRQAAGGEGMVSSYVATAETLEEILTSWAVETPVPAEARRRVAAELDEVGLVAAPARRRRASRKAG
jgi:hypothetical protein